MGRKRPHSEISQEESNAPPKGQEHKRPCPGCIEWFSAESFDRHYITHYPECGYDCPWPDCTSCQVQSGNLVTHVDTHAGLRRKQCRDCGVWSDAARSSRHSCEARKAKEDEEDRRHKRRKVASPQAEAAVLSKGQAHASSSRLQDDRQVALNPFNGPIAGPSGSSYTDYSHDLAFGIDDGGIVPDFLQTHGHWLPQPSFTVNDFRTSTITPVQLDAPTNTQLTQQSLDGHYAGAEQYYAEPGPSYQGGAAPQGLQQPEDPGFGFDLNEHWLDFDLPPSPQLHPSNPPAQPEFAAQPHFARQPHFTARPRPSAQRQPAAQPDIPLRQDQPRTVHQLPVVPEATRERRSDRQPPIAQPAPVPEAPLQPMPVQPPVAFDMPPVDLAFDWNLAPPALDLAVDAADFAPPALDVPPPALDVPPPALDVPPPAQDFPPPALDFAPVFDLALPDPLPHHEFEYPQPYAPLPDWLQYSLQDEFSLLMDAPALPELPAYAPPPALPELPAYAPLPALPELPAYAPPPAFPEYPAYAPLPDINFAFQPGAEFGVGENWEWQQLEQPGAAALAGEWIFPGDDQLFPMAQNIDEAPWLLDPRAP